MHNRHHIHRQAPSSSVETIMASTGCCTRPWVPFHASALAKKRMVEVDGCTIRHKGHLCFKLGVLLPSARLRWNCLRPAWSLVFPLPITAQPTNFKTVRLFGWGLLCAKSSPAAIRALAVSTSWVPVERRARNTEHLYSTDEPRKSTTVKVQASNKLIPSHLATASSRQATDMPSFQHLSTKIGIQQIEVARLW